MIDFSQIEQYRENNRIEAKKALGGLPQSIWETYSAFANTLGGMLLLGVEEHPDHSLHTVDLPDPERLIRAVWSIINNPKRVSVNILTNRDVQVVDVDGDSIIAITVPRAQRYDRPVYIDGDPRRGTYRRSGEGDYRCTYEEVQSMLRDAAIQTQDMNVLERVSPDALDGESIRRYRARMRSYRPGHVWEKLEDGEFLSKLGAVGVGTDGGTHPTAAGLLMFGLEGEIVREFPNYRLDYQEQMGSDGRCTDRITSFSGGWSGNLYEFYFRVHEKIVRDVRLPAVWEDGDPMEAAPVYSALREALANCIINADYYGAQGLSIVKRRDRITFSNPGGFRIEVETAKSGGVSDPRNAALIKMFNLVNIGAGAGSGIPNIYSVWRRLGWPQPAIEEQFAPERTTLVLPLRKNSGEKTDARGAAPRSALVQIKKGLIIEYLTEHVSAKKSEIAEYLELKPSRTRDYLNRLIAEDIVMAEGSGKGRVYKLKA